ncbi:MAG: DUF2167 domain-containing protein [Hellea sp.]
MKYSIFTQSLIIGTFLAGAWSAPIYAQNSTAETEASAQAALDTEQLETEYTEEEIVQIKALMAEAEAFNKTVTPKFGKIELPSAGVTLDLGENYYFLDGADTKKIIVEQWGNPPDSKSLGMIFEKDTDAFFYDYAVEVSFDRSGYVSDEDAKDINFDKLLKSMQKDTRSVNPERIKQGYPSVELKGWADTPQYDAENKRLLWSKLLKFGGEEGDTLNYNMRFLGRRGVLEFNYIAVAESLPEVIADMPEMSEMASFNDGHRYADFDETTDKVAAYGVAGLIAGGVAAKKFGLIAILLVFLKKGWIFILAGFAFLGRMFRSKGDKIG